MSLKARASLEVMSSLWIPPMGECKRPDTGWTRPLRRSVLLTLGGAKHGPGKIHLGHGGREPRGDHRGAAAQFGRGLSGTTWLHSRLARAEEPRRGQADFTNGVCENGRYF